MPELIVPAVIAAFAAIDIAITPTVALVIAQIIVTAALVGLQYALRPRPGKGAPTSSTVTGSGAPRFRAYFTHAVMGVARFWEVDTTPLGYGMGYSLIVNCDRFAAIYQIEIDGRKFAPATQAVQDAGGPHWQSFTPNMNINFELANMDPAGRYSRLLHYGFPVLEPVTATCKGFACVHFLMIAGEAKYKGTLFPNGAHTQIRITGNFTPVWDPRDVTQIRADPSTWKVSSNPIIQAADYVTHADGMRRSDDRVAWDTVIAAANVCDTLVQGRLGGALVMEKFAQCALEYSFDEKPNDVLARFMATCMGSWYTDTQGRIAFRIAQWQPPQFTLTDTDFAAFSFSDIESWETAVNQVRATYTEPARDYGALRAPIASNEALIASDGLHVLELNLKEVQSPSQAYRLANHFLVTHSDADTLIMTLVPRALRLAWEIRKNGRVVINIASNIYPELNQSWEVLMLTPTGVGLARWNASLREIREDMFANVVPDTDPVGSLPLSSVATLTAPVITVTVASGSDVIQIVATSADVSWSLQGQYRLAGATDWLDMANFGRLTTQSPDLGPGTYNVQANWVTPQGRQSPASTGSATIAASPVPAAPVALVAATSTSLAALTGTAANDTHTAALQFWVAASGAGFGAAAHANAQVYCVANQSVTTNYSHSAATLDFYVTARNSGGADSTPFGPVSATIP